MYTTPEYKILMAMAEDVITTSQTKPTQPPKPETEEDEV